MTEKINKKYFIFGLILLCVPFKYNKSMNLVYTAYTKYTGVEFPTGIFIFRIFMTLFTVKIKGINNLTLKYQSICMSYTCT